MKPPYFISVVIFFLALKVAAQNPHFRFITYGLSDGLSQSMVKRIVQDKKGFMWFATQDGLNRFDGQKFKSYSKGQAPFGMPWGNIEGMIADTINNLLWLATAEKGLTAFNPESETFTRYPGTNSQPLPSQMMNAVFQTASQVWGCTKKGIGIINKKTGLLEKNLLPGQNIVTIFFYNDAQVIAWSYEGSAWLIDAHNGFVVDSVNHSNLFHEPHNFEVFTGYMHQDSIYVNTRKGIFKAPSWQQLKQRGPIREKLITHEGRDVSGEVIYTSLFDSGDNFWVGVDSIGLLYRPAGKTLFYHYKKNPSNRFSVDNYFWEIVESRNGIVWIGTDNGVSRQIAKPAFIRTLGEETDLPQNRLYRVFSLCAVDDSLLLYGRRGDAFVYNLYTDEIKTIRNKIGHEYRRIYIIKPFTQQIFFAGTTSGLYFIENKNGQFFIRKPVEYPELSALSTKYINAIWPIDPDTYLIGGISGTGLWKWNKRKHSLQAYLHDTANAHSLVDNDVTTIYQHKENQYWIGTQHGLSLFDDSQQLFKNYFNKKDSTYYVYDIIEAGGYVWMSFYHEGLARWRPATGTLRIYNSDDGLSSTSVYNLRKDNVGKIWFGTNTGLTAFDIRNQVPVNYTIQDGIQGNEFNGYAIYETQRHIYFGGINGITIIRKNLPGAGRRSPGIAFTGVQYINGNQYQAYHFSNHESVSLKHFNNDIILQFASLDFFTNHRTQFAYMLDGYDNDWIYNHPGNEVAYTNLDPGHYIFKIKAVNPEFSGEPKVASLPIRIIPAWYQTLAFKIAVVLIFLWLVYLLVRAYYTAKLRQQKAAYEKMMAIQEERNRISAEIHDDIGAGLSGVRLLTELTRKKTESPELQKEVDKIYSSVSELSGKMREVIWSLNTDNDSLENLLVYLKRQAQQLFENSTVRLFVTMPDEVPDLQINGDKRRHIYLAVKEALHNCLKHSGASVCNLKVVVEAKHLLITVTDNGEGYANLESANGYGLKNINRRIHLLKGRVHTKTRPGTVIEFFIPLNGQV